MQEDHVWISFEEFKTWGYYNGFAYDDISDDEITQVLENDRFIVESVNLNKGWQTQVNNIETHIHRIAKLTQEIGILGIKKEYSISMTVSFNGFFSRFYFNAFKCPSLICDGHHRIRALQYLGYDSFLLC